MPDTQPSLSISRYVAGELLWWVGWFALSFLVGWDISDQVTSGWFWIIATALVTFSVLRWRRIQSVGAAAPRPVGHHDVAAVHEGSRRTQRGMVIYFAIALLVLIVASASAGPSVAEGRSILLGDDFASETSNFDNWTEGFGALGAEILGLTVYDYSLLVGLVFIMLEVFRVLRQPRGIRGLWFRDTLASLSTQIPFYVVEILSLLAMITTYFVLWDNITPLQLPINGWTMLAGVVAADFAYYWEHRTSHEVRLLWTGHAVHHSSPIFNTAVAFRFGPLEPFVAIMFHLPLILLGFHPAIVIMGELAVQAYQFWIHTDVIGRLGPVDRVLNTPSNHRVHHGSDRKYLDRNHGGIFMIWDHLFGTYQAEEETPTYGLTTQINTTNPLKVWTSEFPSLFADLRNTTTWRDFFGYLINPPGWQPAAATDTST